MINDWLIKNTQLVNEGEITEKDVLIRNGRIEKIACDIVANDTIEVIDANGRFLLPGLIDDQVHFREPGLTHKADLFSESKAAVAGGVTSFMDMPNVIPPTLNASLIAEKKKAAAGRASANYAFYLGASNNNLEDISAIDPQTIAGIKVFMGASTGNLLVDDEAILTQIFSRAPCLIATHCENSKRITNNLEIQKKVWDENIPASAHPLIRDHEACFQSSSLAIRVAKQTNARLHILHLTTAKELDLFTPGFAHKQITAEACVHHLLFDESDYQQLGMRLKCNPAVKSHADQQSLRLAVLDGRIDVIATDHAPHLLSEKERPYQTAAAGLPLVEYALPGFLECVADGHWKMTDVARAGAHRVADIFNIIDRGYLREGYFADLVLVEKNASPTLPTRPPLSKCAWSPFTHYPFHYHVSMTFVNGCCAFRNNSPTPFCAGMELTFNR